MAESRVNVGAMMCALIAMAMCGCGGGEEGNAPAAGMGGMSGSSTTGGAGGAGASSGGTNAGGSSSGSGGSSAAAGGGAGGQSGAAGAGGSGVAGCMRVPTSDATCLDNFPEAPQAYACADLRSGLTLDDSHDNTCWVGNFVPGATYAYCCPP